MERLFINISVVSVSIFIFKGLRILVEVDDEVEERQRDSKGMLMQQHKVRNKLNHIAWLHSR